MKISFGAVYHIKTNSNKDISKLIFPYSVNRYLVRQVDDTDILLLSDKDQEDFQKIKETTYKIDKDVFEKALIKGYLSKAIEIDLTTKN